MIIITLDFGTEMFEHLFISSDVLSNYDKTSQSLSFLFDTTVETPLTVTSQQQPPPYNSQFLISPKFSFTIYLTSP